MPPSNEGHFGTDELNMDYFVHFSNGWNISGIIRDELGNRYRVEVKYIDYTKEEAIKLFLEEYDTEHGSNAYREMC